MATLKDDEIRRLLGELPRTSASDDFTARVMDRLDDAGRRDPGLRRRYLALSIAAIAFLGAMGTHMYQQHRSRVEAANRVIELREEYRALQAELEALRDMASDAEPVLDLGSAGDVDFIFDLRNLSRDRGGAGARPASHSRER